MSEQYMVVKDDIPWAGSGQLAYSRGQLIHVDAVKANGWDDYVTSRGSKEAKQLLADLTGEPLPDEPAPKPSTAEKKG